MDFNEKQIRRIFFLSLNLMHKKLVKRTEETIVLNERHNDLELKNCAIDNWCKAYAFGSCIEWQEMLFQNK